MPDIIHLLPDSIANQIAAGEVIQRPASAVKELLENSIDAGANNIKLIIKDVGRTLLQVIDNGCGMSETDARMSFERHATSKIKTIDDLFAIMTKGFRGEALASIAAVAQVELKTKKVEDELGNIIEIENSEVKKQEPCQCADGTSISVKNLFYNVPARRNFLKSNSVELRHIIDEFQRIALAHPKISFSLHHNGLELFHINSANLRQRIVSIFGNNYNEKLVPVEENTNVVNIYGFIGKPDSAKKTRGEQFFFVNNRFIKNMYLNHAVMSAYDELLPKGSYPLYVLFIDIDPKRIDINVHPTKQEIKFDDEKLVYAFVHAAVKRGLGKYSITPTLDFEQEQSFNRIENFIDRDAVVEKSNSGGKTFAPTPLQNSNLKNWEKLFEQHPEQNFPSKEEEIKTPLLDENWQGDDFAEEEKIPYQLHNKYIITQIKSGFIMIDQQAAHERILFEKYLEALTKNQILSQQQLFPQTISLSATDSEMLKEILHEVNALGFDIQEFGRNTFVVHGIPSVITGGSEQQVIEGILEQYKYNMRDLKLDKKENLARAMARNSSIKSGQTIDAKAMKSLIDELFACEMPYNSPSGKLTFITFDLAELEKQFEKKT